MFKRKMSSVPSLSFMNSIFEQEIVNAPSLDYGKKHEAEAKANFLSLNQVSTSAWVWSDGEQWVSIFGGSPDGILCDSGKVGIVEIKCPYAARNWTIEETCDRVKDFSLSKVNNTI